MIDQTMSRLTAPLRAILETFASSSLYAQQYATYVSPKAERRYTPEMINYLEENEIFVFGSNLQGWHGGGAAAAAHMWFGAIWGCGVGIQGQSYAIPTMHGGVKEIKPFVDEFIIYAKEHPELTFLVTRIGCGIAGFHDEDIAPLFKGCEESENIILPKSFHDVLEKMGKKSDNREEFNLSRFHEAQAMHYQIALAEIKDGYKRSHWMWYIFPQIMGLGKSSTSQYYGITCLDEARAYLDDEILGARLREICAELLKHSDRSVQGILGGIDSMKLKSSMTLFDAVSPDDVFAKVLDVFFFGKRDKLTLEIINR
jgi:uncharacterized protein (DUF1810 family)